MGALWSEETKFQKWLDVEIAVCEVHAEMGTIPREALKQIKSRAKFSVARINEIEKTGVLHVTGNPGRSNCFALNLEAIRKMPRIKQVAEEKVGATDCTL